jgi:hypothetical protein
MEVEALGVFAVQPPQKLKLVRGFDAFRDDTQPEIPGVN